MNPWTVEITGSKKEIIVALPTLGLPSQVAAAVTSLMDMHSEVPGWADEDPTETWEKTVPHTSDDVPPPKRDDLWLSQWRVQTSGHPEKQGTLSIVVDAIRSPK